MSAQKKKVKFFSISKLLIKFLPFSLKILLRDKGYNISCKNEASILLMIEERES